MNLRVNSYLLATLLTNSYTPKNSCITWPLFSDRTSFNLRITRLFMYLYQSRRPLNSRITWQHNFKSESEELAHYLAALFRSESKESTS